MNLRHNQPDDRAAWSIARASRAVAGAVLALGAAAGIAAAPAAAATSKATVASSVRAATPGLRTRPKVAPDTVVAAPASSHLGAIEDVVSGRVHAEANPDTPGSAFISFGGLTDMGPTDDGSSPQTPLGFTLDYFGTNYTSVYVNENGNLTFTGPLSTYTPFGIGSAGTDIIAPFFADADSNNGGATTLYGATTLDGHNVFVAEWPYVDCYTSDGSASDTEDDFEVILINRPDLGAGAFQIEYNYDQIQWDAGEASDGTTGSPNCQSQTNSDAAVVGFSNASGSESYELPGSQTDGAFIDSNESTGLIYNDVNSDTPVSVPASDAPVQGRYIWEVENGSLGTPTSLSGSLTSAVQSGTSITVPPGTAVSASANLNGDQAYEATGTVSYTIYSGAGCTGSVFESAGTGDVTNGSVGGSSAESISAPGTYSWYASYSGDRSNDQASAACIGTETVSQPATTTSNTVHTSGSTTGATAFDVATVSPVSGGATPTGTASFALYGSGGCTSTALQTSGPTALSGGSAQSSTSTPLPAGTYYYQSVYTPAEGSTYNGSTSACTSFTVSLTAPVSYTTQQHEGNGSPWTGNEVHPITHYEVASVTGVTGVDPTGSVTFNLYSGSSSCGGSPSTATISVSGGSPSSPTATAQSPTTGTLNAGSYSYSANYSGDGNYSSAASGCVAFSVGKAATAISASSSPSSTMYGNTVQLSATGLPADATGTVTFTSGGSTLCSQSVSNGGASCPTVDLPAGSYPVTATYGGDTNYQGSNTTTSFTISQASTSLSASASPTSTAYGNKVTLTASGLPTGGTGVLAATGTVTFTITGTGTTLCSQPVSAGGASCMTGFLAAASYAVTATYSGDSNYAGSSGTTSFTISKAPTSLTASANPTSTTYGNTVQLSASGLPTGGNGVLAATGTVTFTITGTGTTLCSQSVSAGGASCTTNVLDAATYPVTASYSGDSNYGASSNTTSFTITKAATSLTASANPTSTTYGNIVQLSASGLPTGGNGVLAATGTVTFTITGTGTTLCSQSVSAGGASCTTNVLDAATYPVTASYSGDSNYGASSNTTSFTITKAATSLTASANPTSTTYGNTVQLSASGLPTGGNGVLAATGTVTFTITGTGTTLCSNTVSDGGTSCTTDVLGAGSYPVTATYGGDSNYAGSSNTTSFTITQAPTSLTASASPTSTTYGNKVQLSASGLPTGSDGVLAATGTVTFTVTGTETTLCSNTVSAGAATCTTGYLGAASYAVTATYGGDSNYAGSSNTTSFTITQAPTSFTASAAPSSSAHPGTVVLSAAGLPVPDGPLPATGTVSFTVSGLLLCTGTVADGSASCTTASMAAGTYDVTGTYSGDANYLGSTATTSFTITQGGSAFTAAVNPSTTTYGSTVQLSASGLPSDATGNVTFTAGGVPLCVAGVWTAAATCNTSAVPAGSYRVTATYSGDQNYTSSTASTSFTVTKASILSFAASATPPSAIYPDAVTLTGSGLPSNASGTIVFTAGGSTLCAARVSAGRASCSSGGRPAGLYHVTATYSGDSNYVGTASFTAFVVNAGYWLVASDGGVFSFGGSRFRGSTEEPGFSTPVKGKVVGMAPTADGFGYWLVTDEGQVLPFGDAVAYGDLFTIGKAGSLAAPIVGIAATPDGGGYWLDAADGGVFGFGDAHFHGDTYTIGKESSLAAPVVGIASTPDGGGYWLAAGDGGVFGFGDAHFHGDTYTIGKESSLAAPVVGIAVTPDGGGYWLAAGDGGIFGFGDAHFTGDSYTDGQAGHLSGGVVGIAASPDGLGYWVTTSQGEVLSFGDARDYGDIFTLGLNGQLRGPVVGVVEFPRQVLPPNALQRRAR